MKAALHMPPVRSISAAPAGWPIAAALAFVALVVAWHTSFVLNHDVAWILDGAEGLLEGGRFGVEVDDVNPPLAWWFLIPVVAVAQATGLAIGLVFKVWVGILLVLGTLLLAGLERERTVFVAGSAVVLAGVAGYDYGQREHLMLMLGLPYVMLLAKRTADEPVAPGLVVAVALAGTLAFCMKPHFLIVPAALELWLLWRTRSLARCFRTETLILTAGVVAYLAAILIFAPDYITGSVPRAMANYASFEEPLVSVILVGLPLPLLTLLACAWLTRATDRAPSTSTQSLLVALLGVCVIYVQQSKGFYYHQTPVRAFAALAALTILLDAWRVRAAPLLALVVAAALVAAPAFARSVAMATTAASPTGYEQLVRRIAGRIEQHRSGTPKVMALSRGPLFVHSVVKAAGAEWIGAECGLFLLPAGLTAEADDNQRAIARTQTDAYMARLTQGRPDFLIVRQRNVPRGFPADFGYIEWFSQAYGERFVSVMARYEKVDQAGPYDLYRIRGAASAFLPIANVPTAG